MKLNRKQEGFTIVELLIVIIVIAILATLVLVTFTGTQQAARNTQRQTDIKAVASHLETYMAKNSYYPTLAELNSETFIANELKGLDRESTKDPKGTSYEFASAVSGNQYAYVPLAEDDGVCDNDTAGEECTKFTLSYQEEGGDAKTINNL